MESEHFTSEEAEEYLARIHYEGPIEPTIDALSELQRCHILSVPFENLSVYGKEKIFLTKNWLFDKIVRRHRGGFCYELNTIFSLLLGHFGFKHQIHAAMVYNRYTGLLGPPCDHEILAINIGEGLWLSDVGFGDAFKTPLPFSALPEPQEQQSGIYRIRKDGDEFLYEEKLRIIVNESDLEEMVREKITAHPQWAPRYKFDLIPRTVGDFHGMLLYHQTDPSATFTHGRVCTMAMPWGRITLSGSKIVTTTYLGDNKVKKETKELLGGEEEIAKELEQKFGMRREACF